MPSYLIKSSEYKTLPNKIQKLNEVIFGVKGKREVFKDYTLTRS